MTTSTRTVTVPGAELAVQIHGDLADTTPDRPALLMFGSPMDHTGFATLAGHFTDRVVVTYDPRNVGDSRRDDTSAATPSEQHAEDLHAVIAALDTHRPDAFASSGGALNALLMVAEHPDALRTLVAHEPPMARLLPDRSCCTAAVDDIVATYDAAGQGPATAKFIAMVMHTGQFTDDYLRSPAPDPAMFGLPTEDDGSRDDPLMANLRGGFDHDLDVQSLQAASTRVVIGVGEESGSPTDGEMAGRSAYAVATALGREPVVFPSGHAGFLGGEFGQTGKPEEFATTLRAVLEQR